jgi:NAD(P)-dependent dehydrogenase (short-subunit alcohol dehydrogenase family)
MSSSPILKDKNAIVFGAGGSIGAAVAKEFAAEGAEVFLAGRTKSNVEEVAKEITADGGRAHAAVIDAMDDVAVNEYIDDIAKRSGRIDIVFNAVGVPAKEYGNGKSAVDLAIEEFMLPVTSVLKSQFITARAAARHMVKQHSGVIIFLTGGPARSHVQGTSAIGAAFGAIEALTRNLALDVSPAGVRVVCIRSAAMPDTRTIQETVDAMVGMMNIGKDQAIAALANLTLLKVSPRASDTAKAAAFLASDRARMMTGTVLNSSAGAVAD